MQARLPYWKLSANLYQAYKQVSAQLLACSLEPRFVHLIWLLVSEINGCDFCCELHALDARKAGESDQRLNNLLTWRESALYSARERAAFAWAEALTRIAETHAPDADFEALRPHFSDVEIADLSFAITHMNAWNRLGIGFRMEQ